MTRLIIALVLTLQAGSALALQNIKLAGVDITPVVSSQEKYDSNIYLTRDDVKASLYNRSLAGLGLRKEGARLSVNGGYSVEGLFYTRDHRINDAVHHNANAAVKMQLAGGRTLTADDRYTATTDQATSEYTARAKRVQNNANLAFESPLKGKFGFGVDAQHIINDYLSSNYKTLDRDEIIAGAEMNYKLQPKTKLFLAYHFGSLKYKERALVGANDAVYSNVDMGLSGNLGSKLTGRIMGGIQSRVYRKDLGTASNSRTTGSYGAQINWKPLAKTEVVLYGKRANVESIYSNSRYYVSTLNDLSVSRELNKFKAGLGGSYEAIRYVEEVPGENAKRRDSNWSGRTTLEYNIQKWLKAGAAYTYRSRVSSYRNSNYVDNVTTLELKGMF